MSRGEGRKGKRAKPRGRRERTTRRAPRALTANSVMRVLTGGVAMTPAALLRELGLGHGAQRSVKRLLATLEDAGRVERVRGRYRVRRGDGLIEGVFTPAPDGKTGGSVQREGGEVWSVSDAGGARAGDRVLLLPNEGRRGEVVQVLAGRRDHWLGIFHQRRGTAFVTPYRDAGEWLVRVERKHVVEAEDGEVVRLEPVERREKGRGRAVVDEGPAPAWGRVVERLGRPGDPEADFQALVWRHRLPVDFPRAALDQARAHSSELDPAELGLRVDLRERLFMTIDPASARDFDDAICVEEADDGGVRLWVAIADVAHYVPNDSPLDREALRRGNSVYFPDRAIPMLPEHLSGDVCSLRPNTDRFVMVVELSLDRAARVLRRGLYPAAIRSRARLVYDEAAGVMEGGQAATAELTAALQRLAALTRALRRRRRDSLDFELPEPRVILDEEGHPQDVVRAERSVAHRAVEEAMLVANRTVAQTLVAAGLPAVHRNHDPPAPEALAELRSLLEEFGLLPHHGGDGLSSRELAEGLTRAVGRPVERLVHQTALRSMKQARYGVESRGHYALAFERYTHFTSPIRRYADLAVHRALKALLAGRPPALSEAHARRIAGRASFRERLAVDAEREMLMLKCCALMAQHVGEVFEGSVTGVARHGLYVTLDAHFVEGIVHVSALPEYVVHDERHWALVAQGSGRRYALGDRLRVRLVEVDPVRARIGLVLEESDAPRPGVRGRRRAGRSRRR